MEIGRTFTAQIGNNMYKFLIINQPIWAVKQHLNFFARKNNKPGCRVYIHPYNRLFCNVEIFLHPNYAYCVVINYIRYNKKECKCSEKALNFINSF